MSEVRYHLPNGTYLLKDVDLELRQGEWTFVIGRSGSGKSTLGRLCAGLLQPTHGSVFCCKRIGWLAQNPSDTLLGPTVYEDVAFGARNFGVTGAELDQCVRAALAAVGIGADQYARDPHTLSGGERQRVALAGALAVQPEMLVLDEPTSMIDTESAALIMSAIQTAVHVGCCVLQITHDAQEATAAHRVVVVANGRIIGNGPPTDVLRNNNLLVAAGAVVDTETVRHAPLVCVSSAQTRQVRSANLLQVSARSVSYNYNLDGRSMMALDKVNLEVRSGERVALLGKPGSGKSTLLQVLAGLLPPSNGCVLYNGHVMATEAQKRLLRVRVAISLQQPEDQFFAASVWNEVSFAPRNFGLNRRSIQDLTNTALALVGLDPASFGPRSPFTLSGGERRRVALASALVTHPDLVLLDEPLVGLDLATGSEVWQSVDKYLQDSGAACVVATHNAAWAANWADKRLVLEAGQQRMEQAV